MLFREAVMKHFGKVIPAEEFVDQSYNATTPFGFSADNTIGCICVCRDELTHALVRAIEQKWGEAFDFSSLAGCLMAGTTGFSAARHHAPNLDGHKRYTFFAFSHIGIGPNGELGWTVRRGQRNLSPVCGALASFQHELATGKLSLDLDQDDLEQSLLKQRLYRKLTHGEIPDLLTLTLHAYKLMVGDLERLIHKQVDLKHNDYAIFAGVLIHGPSGITYVWPDTRYVMVGGERRKLSIEALEAQRSPLDCPVDAG